MTNSSAPIAGGAFFFFVALSGIVMTGVTRSTLVSSSHPTQKVKCSQHHKGARKQQEQDDHADRAEDRREGVPEADLSNKNDQDDEESELASA